MIAFERKSNMMDREGDEEGSCVVQSVSTSHRSAYYISEFARVICEATYVITLQSDLTNA